MLAKVHGGRAALPGVRPLFTSDRKQPFAFRIGGFEPGPTIIASGYRASIAPTFDRLISLRSLAWLRGSLILAFVDGIHQPQSRETWDALFAGTIDASVFLGFDQTEAAAPDTAERFQRDAYWTVLRLCAQYGAISGRGIPAETTGMTDRIH